MYSELYAAWQQEVKNAELQPLPQDFYARTSDYLRRIKEESRLLDKKTPKAVLLEKELQNVKQIINMLLSARYTKLVMIISENQKIPTASLTAEEAKVSVGFLPFAEAYQGFAKSLLQGQELKVACEMPHKRVTLRFIKSIPGVIGSDMKTYGPFMAEDVASLPVENAKILVKQGLAEVVEVS